MQGKYGVSIYDMGPATPAQIGSITSGSNRYISARSSTGTFAGGGGESGTTTFTASISNNAVSSAYYDNGGKGDAGTSDPYANERSLYQGNPGTSSGTKKSQVLFRSIEEIVGSTVYNYDDFTVTKIEVYLRNRHSYLSGGLTTRIGLTTSNSLGSSSPSSGTGSPVTTTFTKGQGKWITLSSSQRSTIVSDADRWGILISMTSAPATYDSTSSNYGYFDGALLSDRPRVRITYTYTA
jgi:hypothetical protein